MELQVESIKILQTFEKNNIQIIYYNKLDKAYASTTSTNTIKPKIMQKQLQLPIEKQELFVKRLIIYKVKNQFKTIKYYNKYYKTKGSDLTKIINNLSGDLKNCKQILDNSTDIRKDMFLWEARCALQYWKAFKIICSYKKITFDKREH